MNWTLSDIEQLKKKGKIRWTRSEITKAAIDELTLRKCRVRQVHNVPFGKRRNHIQKGWPDIQGYSKEGIAVLVEVKTENDVLSKEQIERLTDASKCGCKCFIATVNKNGHFELKEFKNE